LQIIRLRAVRKLTDTVPGTLSPEYDALYARLEAVDCAGIYSANASFAGVLLGSLGAIAGGVDRLQPFVSLVRGPGHGRCGVKPCGVL